MIGAEVDQVSRAMAAVAIAIALISAAAAWRSARHAGKSVELERERRAEEKERQSRAEATAHFETQIRPAGEGWTRPHEDHFLIVENRGEAPAREVGLTLYGADGEVLQGVLICGEDELPIAKIDSGGHYPIRAIFAWGGPDRFRLRIEWTDDTGRRENVLPLSST